MNGNDQKSLGRWHATKDRQEDAHWDDKPEKDEIDEDAEYERGIELMMQGWEDEDNY
tara:strand:+ start:613 stop:783 length:171 start_codon:yes stop_codon:yes gene_type:complete